MATKSEYQYAVLTDGDKRALIEPELRNVEMELYRASISPAEIDTRDLQKRAEALKTAYEALEV